MGEHDNPNGAEVRPKGRFETIILASLEALGNVHLRPRLAATALADGGPWAPVIDIWPLKMRRAADTEST